MPIRVAAPLNLCEIVAAFCGLPVHAKANRWLLSNKRNRGRKAGRSPSESAWREVGLGYHRGGFTISLNVELSTAGTPS
jgi:hypothetical protein